MGKARELPVLPPDRLPERKVEVSAEVMKAMQEALCDYRLASPLTEFPDLRALTKPLTYVVDANGIWLIKQTPLGVGVSKAQELKGTKPVLKEGFALQVPKVPWVLYASIVQWFRHVHQLHKSEAYVQLWLRREGTAPVPDGVLSAESAEPGSMYYVYVPEQDVSGGGVEHEGKHDLNGELNHVHVMDIHSHHTMGAFWSGTDDGDEKKHERLYGVVGTIDKTMPSSKWRTCLSGKFIDLDMHHVIDIPQLEQAFTIDFGALLKAGGQVDLSRVAVDPFEGATFPPEWDKALITERKGLPFGHRYPSVYGRGGHEWAGDDDRDDLPLVYLDRTGGPEKLMLIRGGKLYEVGWEKGTRTEKFIRDLAH